MLAQTHIRKILGVKVELRYPKGFAKLSIYFVIGITVELNRRMENRTKIIALLRAFGVPALMCVVALLQLYQVHVNGLTRWKGGGFGMYSEFHANSRQVMYREGIGSYIPLNRVPLEIQQHAQLYISPVQLEAISKDYQRDTGTPLGIEVWMPTYDFRSREITRVPVSLYLPNDHKDAAQ